MRAIERDRVCGHALRIGSSWLPLAKRARDLARGMHRHPLRVPGIAHRQFLLLALPPAAVFVHTNKKSQAGRGARAWASLQRASARETHGGAKSRERRAKQSSLDER